MEHDRQKTCTRFRLEITHRDHQQEQDGAVISRHTAFLACKRHWNHCHFNVTTFRRVIDPSSYMPIIWCYVDHCCIPQLSTFIDEIIYSNFTSDGSLFHQFFQYSFNRIWIIDRIESWWRGFSLAVRRYIHDERSPEVPSKCLNVFVIPPALSLHAFLSRYMLRMNISKSPAGFSTRVQGC